MNPRPNIDTETPGWEVFSAICLDSYNDVSDSNINLDIYKRIHQIGEPTGTGYWGALYCAGPFLDGHMEAIIAHRGTSSLKDGLRDLEIWLGLSLTQIPDARKFAAECFQKLYDSYRMPGESMDSFMLRNKIWNTGHSLGGIVSDAVSALDFKSGSCTIENPGSRDILETYYHIMSNPPGHGGFVTLQTTPNFINTLKQQMGTVYQMFDCLNGFDFITAQLIMQPKSISWNVFTNAWYIPYTFSGHRINNIYEALQDFDHFPVMGEMSWYPNGIQNGYHYLLDTYVFRSFWEDFYSHIWDANHHGMTRRDFIEDGIKHINSVRNTINPAVTDKKKQSFRLPSAYDQNRMFKQQQITDKPAVYVKSSKHQQKTWGQTCIMQ